MDAQWLDVWIASFSRWCGELGLDYLSYTWNVYGLVSVLLVAFICGAIGSLVVGNRMAFFSDALAHCAFAGVALGLLFGLAIGMQSMEEFRHWTRLIMVGFGVVVGLLIALVRERTDLPSDTVIGVFFAGALGFGAMIMQAVAVIPPVHGQKIFTLEHFLFGDPLYAQGADLIWLFVLALVTLGFLAWIYNRLVFTSFNTSLAQSRQISVRLCNYLFIVLLAVVVNLCLNIVGALLINALLIVPAAAAANLSRNMRQLFRWTVLLCLAVGGLGHYLSHSLSISVPASPLPIQFGAGGTIIVLAVLLFAVSMKVGPWLRGVTDYGPERREAIEQQGAA